MYACARYGIPVTVIAPEGATPSKLYRIRLLGGTVETHGRDFDVAKEYAKEKARKFGGVFWEDGVIEEMATGAGTIATELLRDQEPWDMVVVPLGNGSLIKGIAQEMKRRSPDTEDRRCRAGRKHPRWRRRFSANSGTNRPRSIR